MGIGVSREPELGRFGPGPSPTANVPTASVAMGSLVILRLETTAMTNTPTQQYRLSGLLSSHTNDVRSLASSPSSTLFSTSRDKTAKRWARKRPQDDQTGGWELQSTYSSSEWINASAWLGHPSNDDHPGEHSVAAPALYPTFHTSHAHQRPFLPRRLPPNRRPGFTRQRL